MSLRRQFVLVLAAFGLLVGASLGVVSWRIARDALEAELDRRLTQVASAVATTAFDRAVLILEPGLEDGELYSYNQARLDSLTHVVEEAFIFRFTDRSLLVSSSGRPIGSELFFLEPYLDDITEAMRVGSATTPMFLDDDGRPMKYGFVPIEGSEAILGVLINADFYAPIDRLRRTLVGGTVVTILLLGFVGALLAAGVVRPLEELSRAALRIQRGRLDRPVTLEGENEVARLARAMERMRAGIVEHDHQLRLMLAQVAHEVRNPLGGLELFATAAAESEDPHERDRLLARFRAEVTALNRIIDDFLAFARPLQPEYEPVDLREPIAEAVDLARADVEARGGTLESALPPYPLMATVDRDQVKRAVLNLLRNAADAGERTRVWAEAEHGEVMVAVLDDGPGIAREEREHVFDAFVTEKEKGAGLGLSIVRKVAEAHGGRVEIREASDETFGNGAEFRLYLTGVIEPSHGSHEPAPAG